MITRSSIHNPIVKAFLDGIFFHIFSELFPKCRLVAQVAVALRCSFPESCASTVGRLKLQHICKFLDSRSLHVTGKIYSLLFHPYEIACHGDAQLVSATGPTAVRINRRYSTYNFWQDSFCEWHGAMHENKQLGG